MTATGTYQASPIERRRSTKAQVMCPPNIYHFYHFGDFYPSGVNAGEKIEKTLRETAPDADIYFERVAVTDAQINDWNLPTRPTKATDTRAKNFGSMSVELDSIKPDLLRGLVEQSIERHLPADQFKILKIAEASERDFLKAWARQGAA
jgi:hypothetical protein